MKTATTMIGIGGIAVGLVAGLTFGIFEHTKKSHTTIENKTFVTPDTTSSSSNASDGSQVSTGNAVSQASAKTENTLKFSSIHINAGYKNVLIKRGAINNIAFSGDELTNKDGVLTINVPKQSGFSLDFDDDDDGNNTIVITTMESLDSVDISTNNGDIDVKDAQISSLKLTSTSGDLEVERSQITNLNISSNSGDVSLGNLVLQLNSEVITSRGDVELYGISGVNIDARGRRGSFTSNQANVAGLLSIHATTGDIEQEIDD